jgi:hypothetical protein
MFKLTSIILASGLCISSIGAATGQGTPAATEKAAANAKSQKKTMTKKQKKAAAKRLEFLKGTSNWAKQYSNLTDPQELKKIEATSEKLWSQYTGGFGTKSKIATDLALIRARASSAAKSRKTVARNWQQAIQLLPISTSGRRRMGLHIEAGRSAAKAGDYRAAENFYLSATAFARLVSKDEAKTRLYITMQELGVTGKGLEWRRLNDRLLDMRRQSEAFAMWSVPRLDALLVESELRLAYQPGDYEEKRAELGALKAKIELAQKGMDISMPRQHLERVRTLYYALEDHMAL